MLDLIKCREEIDKIDKKIVELFKERMQVSKDVAKYKISNNKPVLDKEREQQKISELCDMADNDFNRQGIKELFSQIMSMSRKLQYTLVANNEVTESFARIDTLPKNKNTKVVFFGLPGSYTEQAMAECFGEKITSFSAQTFKEVMQSVKNKEADYGVLPIENTTTGGITDIYDLLVEFDNYIVAEHVIKVDQALIALPDTNIEDIKKVYSHQQGILQCKEFLKQYPYIQTIDYGSTSAAAKKVLSDNDKSQAAIAGVRAAKTYGLTVLKEKINNEDNNSTRFIIITSKKNYLKNANKVSICFSLPHKSGTLYNMLSHIIFNNLNMTKIESRPLKGKKFEYRFFVDFDGNFDEAAVKNTLSGIESEALELKILGNYEAIL